MAKDSQDSPGPIDFATTHWSVVLSAGRDSPAAARAALSALCEAYWYPLYAYVRRRGSSSDDAHDLTQAFFAQILEKGSLSAADPAKGKFRAFLLASMKNFLANDRDRVRAAKRGGGRRIFSIDGAAAERRYVAEPADPETPEKLFERRWALALLERTLDRLRAIHAESGRAGELGRLRVYLTGEAGAPPYRETARDLGMTEEAVKAAVHRLRRRYREELRREIAETVTDPREIAEEIRDLFAAFET